MITNDSFVTKVGQKDVFSIKKSNNSHKLVGNGEKNFNTDHCTTNCTTKFSEKTSSCINVNFVF